MKHIIHKLDKTFENRLRLGIMSVLIVNDWIDFKELKDLLEATDGNLSSHLKGLQKQDYIEMRKQFIGNKPNTAFRVTQQGREAFQSHLDALEKLFKNNS